MRQISGLEREEKVRTFLENLAPRCSASTQNQALNAIVFLYRDVVREPLDVLPVPGNVVSFESR